MMALRKLFRNTLFRLSLLGALFFVVALFIALGNVYYLSISSEIRRVDRELTAEVAELQTILETEGIVRVGREVILRSVATDRGYLLITRAGDGEQVVVGNLSEQVLKLNDKEQVTLGDSEGQEFSKLTFTLVIPPTQEEGEQERRMRGLSAYLRVEDRNIGAITVSRDIEPTMRVAERVKNAIWTSSGIALFLGLLSSWYVSRRFTQRVEAFNRLASDVRAGHLDRRAPRNYSEDEMDLLAEHLNAMLDHIDRLMKAMRYAGDSIAHDLRSPLTRLRTRLETAATEINNPEAGDTLRLAADDAGELLKTFDSVLRIARLETGERRELLHEIDPGPVLEDIAELYEPACEDAGLAFSANIEPGHTILADRGLLSQAVSNLVENAIKYTPNGGSLTLTLSKNTAGRSLIAVTDDGPGIPGRDRERVKERFVRLDSSRSAPGSGLGLALVDAIADLHRGKFELLDGAGDAGLSAQISFPRIRARK